MEAMHEAPLGTEGWPPGWRDWLVGGPAACGVCLGRSHGVSKDLGKGQTLRDQGRGGKPVQ